MPCHWHNTYPPTQQDQAWILPLFQGQTPVAVAEGHHLWVSLRTAVASTQAVDTVTIGAPHVGAFGDQIHVTATLNGVNHHVYYQLATLPVTAPPPHPNLPPMLLGYVQGLLLRVTT
ncbi:hypothetical protein [Plasticicumulans sp.]|uniref:hypothetical protein n=1 Tax=Plasticicumulans sp. TaxID=2307179 RepID=UPI00395E991C|nr:hypothetical protein [Pseudomonadota bacterium]